MSYLCYIHNVNNYADKILSYNVLICVNLEQYFLLFIYVAIGYHK